MLRASPFVGPRQPGGRSSHVPPQRRATPGALVRHVNDSIALPAIDRLSTAMPRFGRASQIAEHAKWTDLEGAGVFMPDNPEVRLAHLAAVVTRAAGATPRK